MRPVSGTKSTMATWKVWLSGANAYPDYLC
jgi:hypothetical protein